MSEKPKKEKPKKEKSRDPQHTKPPAMRAATHCANPDCQQELPDLRRAYFPDLGVVCRPCYRTLWDQDDCDT